MFEIWLHYLSLFIMNTDIKSMFSFTFKEPLFGFSETYNASKIEIFHCLIIIHRPYDSNIKQILVFLFAIIPTYFVAFSYLQFPRDSSNQTPDYIARQLFKKETCPNRELTPGNLLIRTP